jgi:hypothetical protein
MTPGSPRRQRRRQDLDSPPGTPAIHRPADADQPAQQETSSPALPPASPGQLIAASATYPPKPDHGVCSSCCSPAPACDGASNRLASLRHRPEPPQDRRTTGLLGCRRAMSWKDGGALGGTRTPNLLIRSQMLYPLSYERRACLNSVRRPGSLLAAVGPSPAMICCRVDVYLPEQGDDPEELLARVISPPHFPIRPKQLGNGWPFNAVQPGHHEFEGFSVDALEIPHKGGRTKAVARSATGSATVPARWLTFADHSPTAFGPGPDGTGVCHEAASRWPATPTCSSTIPSTPRPELPRLGFLGHSAIEYAVAPAPGNSRCSTTTRGVPMLRSTPWWRPTRRRPSASSQPMTA